MKYVNGGGHLLIMDAVTILDGSGKQGEKSHELAIYNFKACTLHVCISFHPNEISFQNSSIPLKSFPLIIIYLQILYMNCLFFLPPFMFKSPTKKMLMVGKRAMYLLLLGPPIHTVKYDMRFKGWVAKISERSLCLLPIFISCCGIGEGVGTKRWGDKMLDCT